MRKQHPDFYQKLVYYAKSPVWLWMMRMQSRGSRSTACVCVWPFTKRNSCIFWLNYNQAKVKWKWKKKENMGFWNAGGKSSSIIFIRRKRRRDEEEGEEEEKANEDCDRSKTIRLTSFTFLRICWCCWFGWWVRHSQFAVGCFHLIPVAWRRRKKRLHTIPVSLCSSPFLSSLVFLSLSKLFASVCALYGYRITA